MLKKTTAVWYALRFQTKKFASNKWEQINPQFLWWQVKLPREKSHFTLYDTKNINCVNEMSLQIFQSALIEICFCAQSVNCAFENHACCKWQNLLTTKFSIITFRTAFWIQWKYLEIYLFHWQLRNWCELHDVFKLNRRIPFGIFTRRIST